LTGRRQLIVNADDFGLTEDINDGILEAHSRGIVTATTLMASAPAFEHAAALARAHPGLDVGCHLTLTGGDSLVAPHLPLPATPARLARAIAARQVRVYDELVAQIRRLVDAGIRPSHLDAHKHVHMLPPVTRAVARLAREFRIRWVRRPLAVPVLGPMLGLTLFRAGCRMTDNFLGYRQTGRLTKDVLLEVIRRLPPGLSELMCHPGHLGPQLRAAKTRLKESRQRELEALTSPEVIAAIREAGIDLVNFRSLGAGA